MLAVAAVAALFLNERANGSFGLTKYDYYSEKVPTSFLGYRIAEISDIHNNVYSGKINDQLDTEKPDMLVFAGDMIQLSETKLDSVVKIIAAQKDNMKIYAVGGNHEASNGNDARKQIFSELSDAGAKVLANSADTIEENEEKIRIIGIEDSNGETIDDAQAEKIKQTADGLCDKKLLNILVCHRADVFPRISDTQADLVLSGHMHGGVLRLPFVGSVVGKGKGELFPKYTSGIYTENGTEMIVSRGGATTIRKSRGFLTRPRS